KFLYALEERVDGYQLKPFSEAKLIASINSIVRARKKQTPLQKNIKKLRHLVLRKKYDKTISLAKKISTTDHSLDVLIILGECYFLKEEYNVAQLILQQIVAKKPVCKALYLLGRIAMAEGKYNDSLEYLNKAIDVNPLNQDQKIDAGRVYLALGMLNEAEEMFDTVIQANPTYLSMVDIGRSFLNSGDIEKAARFLDKTTDVILETVDVFTDYGAGLLNSGDVEKSLLILRKCIKISPENPSILFPLAQAFLQTENKKNGVTILKRIMELQPDHEEAQKILEELEPEKPEELEGPDNEKADTPISPPE
ncbi:tetratricopeptide repeat protein, partial [Thermodesulfobacteriota bacterium]